MSYGMIIRGDNDVLQISSQLATLNLQAVNFGSGSSISPVPGYDHLVFIRKTTSATAICYKKTFTSATFVLGPSNAAVSVDYIVCRYAGGLGTLTGDYGLQVYSSGGALAFDTRAFTSNTGLGLIDVIEKGTVTNGSVLASLDTYVNINWSYRVSSSGYRGISASTINGYTFSSSSSSPSRDDIIIAKTFS